jgi:hypothetical protein
MKLYAQIYDNFIESYDYLRAFCDTATFEDTINPYDGFVYPGVCMKAPFEIIQYSLVKAIGHANLIHGALRLSTQDVKAPYHVHADDFMGGQYTVIVYLNRPRHCQGGTSFLRHKQTGAVRGIDSPDWQADEASPEAWATEFICPMKSNRALIFDSRLLHRAEPMDGFGADPTDGRLVFVGVF